MNETQYICAVCETPMEVAGKCAKCAATEFKPKYFWAFMALLSHMLNKADGRTEVHISQKLLDRFNPADAPKLKWDPTTDSWILELVSARAQKGLQAKESPVAIEVPNKIGRR